MNVTVRGRSGGHLLAAEWMVTAHLPRSLMFVSVAAAQLSKEKLHILPLRCSGAARSRSRTVPGSDCSLRVKDKLNPAGASSSVGPVDSLCLPAGNESTASRPPRGSPGGVHQRGRTHAESCLHGHRKPDNSTSTVLQRGGGGGGGGGGIGGERGHWLVSSAGAQQCTRSRNTYISLHLALMTHYINITDTAAVKLYSST